MNGKHKLALLCVAAGTVSLFAAGASASAANGAAKPAVHPTSTAGLSAHVSSLKVAGTRAPLSPAQAGARPAVVATSALGAGHTVYLDLASAGVTFTMPSISCASPSDYEWLLPGLWIYDGSGNLVSQVDVNFNCNAGSSYMGDVICIYGGSCDTSMAVYPGDVIEATYVQTASTAAGEIINHTQNTVAVVYGTPGACCNSVLFGNAGPSQFGVSAVPTFNKMNFSVATANGFYLGDWGPYQTNLKTDRFVQIKSSIVPTTKFTNTFMHNY